MQATGTAAIWPKLLEQANIAAGTQKINDAFAQFTPDYFTGIGKNFSDYYMPQLDKQYQDTRRNLIYGLSNTGGLTSSAGNQSIADLENQYNLQRQQVTGGAIDAENQAKIEEQQNQLSEKIAAPEREAAKEKENYEAALNQFKVGNYQSAIASFHLPCVLYNSPRLKYTAG